VEAIIKNAWARAAARGEGPKLMEKVVEVKDALHDWDEKTLKKPMKRIKELKKELERIRRAPLSDANISSQKEIMLRLELLLEQEETYWLQRARANWLKNGDRNTGFFQDFASRRRKKNAIKGLVDENGVLQEDKGTMCQMVQQYFEGLFTSEVNEIDDTVLNDVHRRVTDDMNRDLTAPFSPEEIRKALFQIGDLKAPGPDGMHAIFYKNYWDLIGGDLVQEVVQSLNSRSLPEGWNSTTIVLIPKVKNPTLVTQFRPISLCNVLYKVVSKVLANRLKVILPEIISDQQSAFVPGRLITDNILLAYESIHTIKKKQGKKGLCAIKLDMHKAYDRVEWGFLEKIMQKLGFSRQWTSMIMECVSSVDYTVRFNSVETEIIKPKRGLRQGDPLSPYLFLLVAEGLSAMLKGAEERGEMQGVRVCRQAPVISHLLFADDSLILMQADRQNAEVLKDILDRYCANSGQLVSEAKCSVFFSNNTDVDTKAEVCQTLNIMTEALNDKYLGLPAMIGADRSDCFRHLIDRVLTKTKGWKEKLLSMGGKEILIKSIAQAVPAYAMMVFLLPKNICKGITDVISSFWWGDEDEHRKMHWKAWWKLCIPKGKGGMGFRDLHCFNLAMLAKQIWRILEEPNSLCARVLRARYYPDGKLLEARQKSGSSYTWQSLLAGLQCFKRGYIWRVGDGSQINIWEDSWIPSSHDMKIMTPRGNNILTKVEELINPIDGRWDEDLIKSLFWEVDANRILKIPITNGREDLVAWHLNRNGLFSVRSAYHCQWMHQFGNGMMGEQAGGSGDIDVWAKLWKLNLPSKIKIFGWRALHGMIPCKGMLANKHVGNISGCPICQADCEDIKHILFKCQRVRAVWQQLGVWESIDRLMHVDRSGSIVLQEIIRSNEQVKHLNNVALPDLILTGGWYCWWERRQQVHGENVQPVARSAMSIATLTTNYSKVKKMPIRRRGWQKPPEGKLALNIDAGYSEITGEGSTGAVIRDSSGAVVAMAQKYMNQILDAVTGEALALREGLSLAQSMGISKLIVQSDCLEVVETMKNGGFSAGAAAAVYDECTSWWLEFADISIEHCPREANQPAHILARNALSCKIDNVWNSDPPLFLVQSLVNDVTLVEMQ
jgi:hypothetical protein